MILTNIPLALRRTAKTSNMPRPKTIEGRTTISIPISSDLLRRLNGVLQYGESRSALIRKWIERGVTDMEKKQAKRARDEPDRKP